jgi:hypothetical protein
MVPTCTSRADLSQASRTKSEVHAGSRDLRFSTWRLIPSAENGIGPEMPSPPHGGTISLCSRTLAASLLSISSRIN